MRSFIALTVLLVSVAAYGEERSLTLADGGTVRYELIVPGQASPASAAATAKRFIRLLAAGKIEEASLLSNAPKRRFKVLKDYEREVGNKEFRRIYSRLLEPVNPLLAEVAIGDHRLIVWDLGEAKHELAAQYYVLVEGRFFMDDAPNDTRAELRRVLLAWRADPKLRPKPSARTD